ncbi:MAG: protein kinase domain-containing protein [Isosphaeraceae bacterium]
MDVSLGDKPGKIEHESMLIPEPAKLRDEPGQVPSDARVEVVGDPSSLVVSSDSPTVLRAAGPGSSGRPTAGLPFQVSQYPLPGPGDVIDSFVLEAAIGEGGMGAVYRALDTKLERHVALKLLPPDQANDGEVVQRFYQEGRAAARLDDENIARVFSIGQDGVYHYIAFEYIEGSTVRQRVEAQGALPVAEAVNIALQIAGALVHASRRGIVHRDIKPSNIILTPQGRAKLVDMGLARRFERGADHGLTQSGMTLGTFDYISPEQARDPRDVDVRSDLYSLGCTFFHMLTGRPPFPGGTVLQKLIQHQEEPPADVRALNPAVPVELATIISKLMAKDRDRRYQSPEHLMRDLLAVAGSVGLAPPHQVPPHWLADLPRSSWEHHLVWLVPALGFLVVVAGLVWWGRELTRPATRSSTFPTGVAAVRLAEPGRSSAPEASPAAGSAAESGLEPAKALAANSRNIPVSSNEDLLEIVATAPRRSVIILADDGPYWLGRRAWSQSQRSPAPLSNLDLTIKAETGVRPLVKLAGETLRSEERPTALLHFVGGRLSIEGIEFELDAILPEERVAAIRADGTELTVRGCLFRRTNSRDGRNVAALEVRSDPRPATAAERLHIAGERPPAVLIDACHFDGGQTAILAQGAAEVVFRDCTLGPGEPSVWFDNTRSSVPVPAELRLIHTSILAGSEPVFRFDGSQARVWVDESTIASAGRTTATLVTVDNPRNLSWRGRYNLYSQIGLYLTSPGAEGRTEKIDQFARWCETANELRETGSQVWPDSVWESPDPLQSLLVQRDNPTRVFLLAPTITAQTDVGARLGPFGSSLKNVHVAHRAGPRRDEFAEPTGRKPLDERLAAESDASRDKTPARVTPADSRPEAGTPSSEPAAPVDASASVGEPATMPTMPPMPPPAVAQAEGESSTEPGTDPPAGVAGSRREEPAPASRAIAEPDRSERSRPAVSEDEDVIRGTEQFLTMFQRLGSHGGTLRIAAGADLELPTIVVQGLARYHLLAAPGASRPRLRYKPQEAAVRSPFDWSVLFNLRSGSLHLQGLDLVVNDAEPPRADRMAVAGLLPGAELSMADCTVTLAVSRPDDAAFVVEPPLGPPKKSSSAGARGDIGATRGASISLRDCFLRSGGDGIAVASSRKLELELTNVLFCTEGTLLHVAGGPRHKRSDAPAVRARIEQVTAQVKGGLIHLDSTPEEPELATVGIVVENSIMSTAKRDEPLFRLNSREPTDDLGDKVRWEGRKVAYDQIKTYRRDEVVQTGAKPRIYDRDDWLSAFLPKDESPMPGDVKFLHETEPSRAAWKLERDDLRLAPGSSMATDGPDLSRIPQAPPMGDF